MTYITDEDTSPFSGWMSVAEFAKAAKVKPDTAYIWIYRDKVEWEMVNSEYLINPDSLLDVPRESYSGVDKEMTTINVTCDLMDKLRRYAISGNISYTLEFATWVLFAAFGIVPHDRVIPRLVDAARRFQVSRHELHTNLWSIAQGVVNFEED